MSERVLFLLAGLAGVGKTTLLHRALSENLPIFGEPYNGLFQRTNKANRYPEESLTLRDRIDQGTWLDVAHIVKSPGVITALATPVVHFELFWFFVYLRQVDPGYRKKVGSPERLRDSLYSVEENTAIFQAFFQQFLCKSWDKIIVHTLYRPYDEVAADWRRRENRLPRLAKSTALQFVSQHIYNLSPDGKRLYDALYRGWLKAAQASNIHLHITGRTFKDRMMSHNQEP